MPHSCAGAHRRLHAGSPASLTKAADRGSALPASLTRFVEARIAIDAIAARAAPDHGAERAPGGKGAGRDAQALSRCRNAFLFGILLAIMSLTMGRGLSQLQKDILAILEEFPAREDFPEEGTISLLSWAHPQQILQRLKRPPTASNRTAVSKALARLVERGMVAAARDDLYSAGKSFFYVRITGGRPTGVP